MTFRCRRACVRRAGEVVDAAAVATVSERTDPNAITAASKRVPNVRFDLLVHRGVQKIHPFGALASPEQRKRGGRRLGHMNLLSASVH